MIHPACQGANNTPASCQLLSYITAPLPTTSQTVFILAAAASRSLGCPKLIASDIPSAFGSQFGFQAWYSSKTRTTMSLVCGANLFTEQDRID